MRKCFVACCEMLSGWMDGRSLLEKKLLENERKREQPHASTSSSFTFFSSPFFDQSGFFCKFLENVREIGRCLEHITRIEIRTRQGPGWLAVWLLNFRKAGRVTGVPFSRGQWGRVGKRGLKYSRKIHKINTENC